MRILLLPFSWLYGLVLFVRHRLYDTGVFGSSATDVPTIVIGNLALGGTGKTPHVALVLRILINELPLATLSRGYGRRGTGLHEVQRADDPAIAGDEPLMLKRKFSGVHVFVGADRVVGVRTIQQLVPEVKAVVLDDAFQHRKLKAGLNIVLTTWHRPWSSDRLLPAGTLRDLRSRARVADAVIVTKSPHQPSNDDQFRWRKKLGLREDQPLFFSGLKYDAPRSLIDSTMVVPTGKGTSALLFTGVADAAPLVEHARALFDHVKHVAFGDHHIFTPKDQAMLARLFSTFAQGEKTLLTTEKDAARLGTALIAGPLEDLPIAVVGVEAFILNEPNVFAALIRSHVATHTAHR